MRESTLKLLNARRAAVKAAALSSLSPATPDEGFVGGSNGGAPPLTAASRHVTGGVAGESKGTTGNPVAPKVAKPSKQTGNSVQVRIRLPRDFAEMLLAFKPEKRAAALWLSLEGRVVEVWDLPQLINSADQIRRVGVLLNQALRHLGLGGEGNHRLVASVLLAIREIKKLRPPKYDDAISECKVGKDSKKEPVETTGNTEVKLSENFTQTTETPLEKGGEK